MGLCYFACVLIFVVLLLYVCLELHYFVRMTLAVLLARFTKKKAHILEELTVNGICLTTDIDTFVYHMNNARFVRELDFARGDFYERTGLYKKIRSKGGSIAMGATTIRYRRFVKLFSRYQITSRIVYWDDQSIFMEHRFLSPSDKFVNAIVLSRTRIIDCNAENIMSELRDVSSSSDLEGETKLKPEIPLEVAKWCEYNTVSSANLRSDC